MAGADDGGMVYLEIREYVSDRDGESELEDVKQGVVRTWTNSV